jgi:predicted dehydrogenase
MNVALVGSNFGLKGYLPVLNKIKKLKLKIICSRNINKIDFKELKNIEYKSNWKDIFNQNIDIIILAVPPKIQEKILIYNLKYRKQIIFEKPISTSFLKSKKIFEKIKEKKIKSEINLTYLNHILFRKVKKIIDNKSLGSVIDYKINWAFVSGDFNKKIKSWKTDEKQGGGIKNIFLTHVLSYCEYFFKKSLLKSSFIKSSNFKGLNFKKFILLKLKNFKKINGEVLIHIKKNGLQTHKIEINFENGKVKLFTKSKDWTNNFVLKVYKKNKKFKIYKNMSKKFFNDGRSQQIYLMINNFIKKKNYKNIQYCLNAEELNNRLI